MDLRQIQHINQQAEVLFGKEYILEPNFAAPMPVQGVGMSSDAEEDPIDYVGEQHIVLTQAEQAEEEDSPALQDVSMTHLHLHLPGIEEVEALAMLLLELADDSDRLLVPADLRQKIAAAANALHDYDKTTARFVKRYESRWGYTLFGRCLGADFP